MEKEKVTEEFIEKVNNAIKGVEFLRSGFIPYDSAAENVYSTVYDYALNAIKELKPMVADIRQMHVCDFKVTVDDHEVRNNLKLQFIIDQLDQNEVDVMHDDDSLLIVLNDWLQYIKQPQFSIDTV